MGYRIEYTKAGARRKDFPGKLHLKLWIYTLLGVVVGCLLCWSEINAQVVPVLENMAQKLGSGIAFGEVLDAFCMDILQTLKGG